MAWRRVARPIRAKRVKRLTRVLSRYSFTSPRSCHEEHGFLLFPMDFFAVPAVEPSCLSSGFHFRISPFVQRDGHSLFQNFENWRVDDDLKATRTPTRNNALTATRESTKAKSIFIVSLRSFYKRVSSSARASLWLWQAFRTS